MISQPMISTAISRTSTKVAQDDTLDVTMRIVDKSEYMQNEEHPDEIWSTSQCVNIDFQTKADSNAEST